MTYLTITCAEPWYSYLKNGEKEVKGRKGQSKYRELKSNDIVLFKCVGEEEKQFFAIVTKVDVFKTLNKYLTKVTLAKALPHVTDMEEARRIYHQWSTPEEIKEYGFVGIWIKVISNSSL